ncbi:BatD family protein [Aquimarina addita]|uniref:BatD family protein n=1 Tax=Aquimarina addita TaxID=870485 RepID=A0ABP7XBI8_9FLAO
MKLKLIFLTLFFAIAQLSFAQVSFDAKVSKTRLGVNEDLRVDFVMNADGDNFNPPDFKGFTIYRQPSQSINKYNLYGKKSYAKTITFYLKPTKRGKFRIGQATIEIDGETYKTLPVNVEVTSAVQPEKNRNSDSYVASDDIHLVAEVSKLNPYLNEGVTVVYKLYVSPAVNRITGVSIMDTPDYSNFWSHTVKVPNATRFEQGEYNGQPYNYIIYDKKILYPQKTGKVEIEPLTVSVGVVVPTIRRGVFGSTRVMESVDKTIAAGIRTINVKPLPLKNRPADFSGAVGSFDFQITTNKKELAATESMEAKVLVSGTGNVTLFDLPRLSVPNGLEEYEPEHKEQLRPSQGGMSGNISDAYTLIPQYKGEFSIPPVSFSYFDLKSEAYKTITSQEIVINVNKGPDASSINNTVTTSEVNKQAVTQIGNQFRFIKLNTNLQSIGGTSFFKSTAYWVTLLTPLLAIPLFIFFGKKREERLSDISGNRIRKADKLARKYLSEAKKNLGNQIEFYIAMERALHNYLKAKLHIQTSDMSKDRIQRLLKERDVDDTVSIEFIALLESCEFARYTPSSSSAMQQDYDKASRVISSMDKQL